MSERSSNEIAAELHHAEIAQRLAMGRVSDLRKELNEARVRESAEKHPWIGKKVQQFIPARYSSRPGAYRRGTLTIFDPALHRGLRQLYPRCDAGDLFVLTESGRSGYRFYTNEEIDRMSSREGHWELISE